jgi:hypothetical protein
MEKRGKSFLFKGKVYSTKPNSGLSPHSDFEYEHMAKTDEEIYTPINKVDEMEKFGDIYFFDEVETYHLKEKIKAFNENYLNLSFAKKVIADEHYPTYGEHWYYPNWFNPDDHKDDPEKPEPFECLSWGRSVLVDMIGRHKYSEAIPELREILFHDTRGMKGRALWALAPLDRIKSDQVINEYLEEVTDRDLVYDVVHHIHHCAPRVSFLKNLERVFEEYYHDYVTNPLARRWFGTIPQRIVLTCGQIKHVDALRLLEEGIKHPYPHVEHNAKYALWRWIEMISKSTDISPLLHKKAIEMSKKYDIRLFQKEAWKFLPKTPAAGPY